MFSSQEWSASSEEDWNIIKRKKSVHHLTPRDAKIVSEKKELTYKKYPNIGFTYNSIEESNLDILSSTSDETYSDFEKNVNNSKNDIVEEKTNGLLFSNPTLKSKGFLLLSKSLEGSNNDVNKNFTMSSQRIKLISKEAKVNKISIRPYFLAKKIYSWFPFINKFKNQQDQKLTFGELLIYFMLLFFLMLGVWKFFNLLMDVSFNIIKFLDTEDEGLQYSRVSHKKITTFDWNIDLKDFQTTENISIKNRFNDTINKFNDNESIISFESKLYISTIPVNTITQNKQVKEIWKPRGKYLIDFDAERIYKLDTVSIMLNFYEKIVKESKTHYDQIKLLLEREIDKDTKRWSILKDSLNTIKEITKKNIMPINWKTIFWIKQHNDSNIPSS